MNTRSEKSQSDKSQSVGNGLMECQEEGVGTFQFKDHRKETVAQRNLQSIIKSGKNNVAQREEISGTLSGDQTFAIQDNEGRIQLSGTVFNHMRNSIMEAKNMISGAITALGNITPARAVMLRIAFGTTTATQAAVVKTLAANYQKVLDGLNANGLVIKDEAAKFVKQGAEGHVGQFFGIRYGPIHTRFDMSQSKTAFNLIHEGSHLWAGTNDLSYMRLQWDTFMTLWGHHAGNIDTFKVLPEIDGAGHNNADSYSIFAYAAAGLPMP